MKPIVCTAALFVLITGCRPHKKIDRDQLVIEICQAFKDDDRIDEPDETKMKRIIFGHLDRHTFGMPPDSVTALTEFVYIRLQRECREFRDIAHRLHDKDKKSDWTEVDLEPESLATKQECDDFFNAGQLKYLESNGDTVVVDITNSSWTDHFIDGTSSRLSLQRTKPGEFIISFIESNNDIRKNMSHPGDKYRYKIIRKEGSTFFMFVEVVGPGLRSLFKMYY